MKVLFLGGPGNISESAIRYLLEHGHRVAVVKRSRGHMLGLEGRIEVFIGERGDRVSLENCLRLFRPETVVDCCCFEPEEARVFIRLMDEIPCRRFIFISTADVYGYPLSSLPMHESDRWRRPVGEYAEKKKQIEEMYAEAFRKAGPALTIVRPSYSLGKTFALSAFERDRGKYMVMRLKKGLPGMMNP